eukprot:7306-Heterococcus_DN1.PRE.1
MMTRATLEVSAAKHTALTAVDQPNGEPSNDLLQCFSCQLHQACSTCLCTCCYTRLRHGISKWPYRQLLSIDGQLGRLEVDLQKALAVPPPLSSDDLQNVNELQERMSAMRADWAAIVAGEPLKSGDQQQQQQQQQQAPLANTIKKPSRARTAVLVLASSDPGSDSSSSSSDSDGESSKPPPKKRHYRVMRPLDQPLER